MFRYCKSIYQPGTPTGTSSWHSANISLPPNQISSDLASARNWTSISRHSPRLDPVETLQLLPPLVTAQRCPDVFDRALRTPTFDPMSVREINKARNDRLLGSLCSWRPKGLKLRIAECQLAPVLIHFGCWGLILYWSQMSACHKTNWQQCHRGFTLHGMILIYHPGVQRLTSTCYL